MDTPNLITETIPENLSRDQRDTVFKACTRCHGSATDVTLVRTIAIFKSRALPWDNQGSASLAVAIPAY